MNTEDKQSAHECAYLGAHHQHEFTKQKWHAIIGGCILVPVGLLTLPFGAIFLFFAGGAFAMAWVSHIMAAQAHKEFFEIRDEILRRTQHDDS